MNPNGTISTETIPLMSLEELLQTSEALKSSEERDKEKLRNFLNIDQVLLRSRLLTWASLGFPSNYVIYTIDLNNPPVCSDGVNRNLLSYLAFLLPEFSLAAAVSDLQSKLPGMLLSYSYTISNSISIHVSKS